MTRRVGATLPVLGTVLRVGAAITALLAIAVAIPAAIAGAARGAQPNILLFIGDDIDWSYYGFLGHPFVRTPNLDRLANEGAVFVNGYSSASTCRPALRTLLSGIREPTWVHTADVYEGVHPTTPRNRIVRHFYFTLPRLLRQAGYASFAGGKMWEGDYSDAGFDAGTMGTPPVGFSVDGADTFARDSLQPLYEFIHGQSGPWFAWVAPKLPHGPYDPPQEDLDLYQNLGLSTPAIEYFGNLTRMDRRVGEIVEFLVESELAENTLIIYLADNGWEQMLDVETALQDATGGDRGKSSIHDRGFRTPIVFWWPNQIPAGNFADGFVSFEDVYETILDFAGAESHDCSDGRTIRRSVIRGKQKTRTRRIFSSIDRVRTPFQERVDSLADDDPDNDLPLVTVEPGFMLRRGRRWQYSWAPERGIEELYDLRRDPEALDNLAAGRPGTARSMRRLTLKLDAALAAKRCRIAP